ncbi:MAG: outer membrane cobalamin receptor [Halioglobus sp.]|jgi:outer membrane cobalamin receptor
MRFIILISFLLLINGSLTGQQAYEQLRGATLEDVLRDIEKKNKITFSFESESIEEYTIDIQSGKYSLQAVLDLVFSQTRLSYEILDGQHILLTPVASELEQNYICGYIYDRETDRPVLFATIFNKAKTKGTETDTLGYFKMDVSKSERSIFVLYLGYHLLEIRLNSNIGSDCTSYYLDGKIEEFETIVLTEYLSDGIKQSADGNTIILQPSEMDMLPGGVEPDVLSSIQFLPGIISADETLDGLSVRGGTADQNLVLFDGIPMYHTSHFFGTVSAFNPFVIDQVDVYRSGVGSEYGGRVSSVIDIKSDNEITKEFSIGAGINLTHAYLNTSVPLWKGSSLLFSTRRSITDIWNTPTFIKYAEKVFQGTKVDDADFNNAGIPFNDEFRFNDANFKWMWEVGENKFTISALGALNRLNYRAEIPEFEAFSVDFLNLRNAGFDMAWERKWSGIFSSSIDITNSEYNYDYNLSYRLTDQVNFPPPITIDTKNKISDGGFNWTNDLILRNGQNVKFGYQFTENIIDLTFKSKNREEENENGETFRNILHSLFAQYSLNVPKRLHLDVGLRYAYSDEIKNNYFEPRISLITDVSDALKLKVSTSKHFQFISQLVAFDINQLGLNSQIWVASNNKEIPVIESNQWMGGFIYKKDNWTLDVEGYVKELDGITTLTNNFVSLPEQPPFSIGKSRIRGIDLLLKRRIGRYRTWLSYTLSQSLYDFILLTSESVPATHDQTHVMQWVHTYKIKEWEFSLGWQRRSGLPTTLAKGIVEGVNASGESTWSIDYQSLNASRLPSYRKLDASVVYNFGDKSKFHGFISISLQNIFNRDNIIGKQYLLGDEDENGVPELIEINKLGLKLTPNISLNIRY